MYRYPIYRGKNERVAAFGTNISFRLYLPGVLVGTWYPYHIKIKNHDDTMNGVVMWWQVWQGMWHGMWHGHTIDIPTVPAYALLLPTTMLHGVCVPAACRCLPYDTHTHGGSAPC